MRKRDILLILAAVLLLRLPFLNEAVQGDDPKFLTSAIHALIDPLHPNHTHYIFTNVGEDVDFRGNPHPPMNAWYLAALLALFGGVHEVPFHAAFIVFSLMAAMAMYGLALRFSPKPVWATLLFLAVPAFVVNGGSFEADVPHLAYFLTGVATFVYAADRRSLKLLGISALFLGCAALTVIQSLLATPILLLYVYLHSRNWKPGYAVAFTPPLILVAWEVFERITGGVFPLAVTMGYVQQQAWDRMTLRLWSEAGLLVHLCFMVFPPLLAAGLWALRGRRDRDTAFLAGWVGIYLAGCLVLFFSGSARYLLPIAAPIAIAASYAPPRWIAGGFAVQLALSLGLATANYQQWGASRDFAHTVVNAAGGRRIWADVDWGLRHYLEEAGARIPLGAQQVPAGDIVVWSELEDPVRVSHAGTVAAPLAELDVRPKVPFRLIALESRSGFSSIGKGFFPYGISTGLVDRLHADVFKAAQPVRENLPMNAPDADLHIVSGIFGLEEGKWRWTGGIATVMLKTPAGPSPLHAVFYVPDNAPARHASLLLDGEEIYSQVLPGPGTYRLVSPPQQAKGPTSILSLRLDKTFSAPGDSRQLGAVLNEMGWGK